METNDEYGVIDIPLGPTFRESKNPICAQLNSLPIGKAIVLPKDTDRAFQSTYRGLVERINKALRSRRISETEVALWLENRTT